MENPNWLTPTGWGPQDSNQLVYKWLNSLTMVYGRYNELVHGTYFMVYKPTFTSLGKTHPVGRWVHVPCFRPMGLRDDGQQRPEIFDDFCMSS